MASIGGFAGYNEIARTGAPGSFLQGVQNYKSFFDKKAVDDAMKENRGSLADAIMKGDYNTGASIAMNAGDLETALAFADLADKAESRKADIAYQNAQLGLARDKATKEQAGEQALMDSRFSADRLNELKTLNDKAGRWATSWGKALSDMANTDASQAYSEFEGKAKQYVQDQLKKIYGAQMTEQEGERFFKSMGLTPDLDPSVRWSLVESALNDLAIKSGQSLPAISGKTTEVQSSSTQGIQAGYIEDGYRFKGGDPNDPKNWEQI